MRIVAHGVSRRVLVLSGLAIFLVLLLRWHPDPHDLQPARATLIEVGQRFASSEEPVAKRELAGPQVPAPAWDAEAVIEAVGTVEVVDRFGAAVEGVRVDGVHSDDTLSLLGWTDAGGELGVASEAFVAIVASHPRFATKTRNLNQPPPSRVRVRLGEGDWIRGVVRLASGQSVGEGYHVMACDASLAYLPPDASMRAVAGDPRWSFATTNADGWFEIGGLTPGAEYTVAAGGGGRLSTHPAAGVRPGTEPVELIIQDAYWIHVKLAEADGGPPHLSERTAGKLSYELQSARPGEWIPPAWSIALAAQQFAAPDRHTILALATAEDAPPVLGPIVVRADLPGYQPAEVQAFARPIREGPCELELRLAREATDWGSLVLAFHGRPSVTGDARSAQLPLGHVTLRSQRGEFFSFYLDGFGEGEQRIDEIPFGQYELTIEATASPFCYPDARTGRVFVEVQSKPARVEIDLGGLGALELDLWDAGGEPYTGPLHLLLLHGDGSRPGVGGQITFTSAPYVLPALSPGVYSLQSRSPRTTTRGGGAVRPVTIVPGAMERIELQIP